MSSRSRPVPLQSSRARGTFAAAVIASAAKTSASAAGLSRNKYGRSRAPAAMARRHDGPGNSVRSLAGGGDAGGRQRLQAHGYGEHRRHVIAGLSRFGERGKERTPKSATGWPGLQKFPHAPVSCVTRLHASDQRGCIHRQRLQPSPGDRRFAITRRPYHRDQFVEGAGQRSARQSFCRRLVRITELSQLIAIGARLHRRQ